MITTNVEAKMHLIYPPLLTESAKSVAVIDERWMQARGDELARKMGVPSPQIEWGNGDPRRWPNQVCHSPIRQWANIERAGYRIRFDSCAMHALGPKVILFIIAHLIAELNSNEPEWVNDLRALDVLGEIAVPLVEETAILIALTPRDREKALRFKFGPYVVEQGFSFAAEREALAYELPSMLKTPRVRTYPY